MNVATKSLSSEPANSPAKADNGELADAELRAINGGATMAEYGLLLALIAVICTVR